jgi:hypothetical protein
VSRPEKGQKVSLVGAEEQLFVLFADLILSPLFESVAEAVKLRGSTL